MSEKSESVELHPAYQWDCETCGAENFVRATVYDPPPEGLPDMQESGDWMSYPESVTCARCGEQFSTHHMHEET